MATKRKARERELGDPQQVRLPSMFDSIGQAEGTQCIVFKVDESLDWRTVLAGTRIKLNSSGPPEVSKCAEPLGARVAEDAWGQFLPLHPETAASEKLVVTNKVRHVVHLFPATEDLPQVEAALREAAEARGAVERRRTAGAAQQRVLAEGKRKESLARFKIAPIMDALHRVGFPITARDDLTEGAVNQPGDAGQMDTFSLKPLPDIQDDKGSRLPLAFWSAGPLRDDVASELVFKCYGEATRPGARGLLGKVVSATDQEFFGTPLKKRRTGFKYLLGVQARGSRKCFIHEAEVYHVNLKRKEVQKDDTDGQATELNYGQKKGKLISDLGTVKKQRVARLQAAKKSREHKVAEFGMYTSELTQRAEELKSKVVAVEKRDAEVKAKILPPYDPEATQPSEVYKEGVKRIAPPEHVQWESNNLVDQDLADLLQRDPGAQLRSATAAALLPEDAGAEAFGPCRTQVAAAVLAARARAGIKAKDAEAAVRVARQFGVLNSLAVMVARGPRFRGGKCLSQGIAELLNLSEESALASHWHNEYYEEMLGRRKVRAFNGRKALCALMVYALHLAPGQAIEFAPSVERQLLLSTGTLKKSLEYIGCQVTEERQSAGADTPLSVAGKRLLAKLEGPPKLNKAYYEKQSGKKKDGRR